MVCPGALDPRLSASRDPFSVCRLRRCGYRMRFCWQPDHSRNPFGHLINGERTIEKLFQSLHCFKVGRPAAIYPSALLHEVITANAVPKDVGGSVKPSRFSRSPRVSDATRRPEVVDGRIPPRVVADEADEFVDLVPEDAAIALLPPVLPRDAVTCYPYFTSTSRSSFSRGLKNSGWGRRPKSLRAWP
jgi:hypothetical protein